MCIHDLELRLDGYTIVLGFLLGLRAMQKYLARQTVVLVHIWISTVVTYIGHAAYGLLLSKYAHVPLMAII